MTPADPIAGDPAQRGKDFRQCHGAWQRDRPRQCRSRPRLEQHDFPQSLDRKQFAPGNGNGTVVFEGRLINANSMVNRATITVPAPSTPCQQQC